MSTNEGEIDAMEAWAQQGLSSAEAARRLREEGYNELPEPEGGTLLAIVREVLREPMFLMLVACGGIYLLMGREHWADAMMLLGFVVLIITITVIQEWRTDKALQALKDLSSPRSCVFRDGHKIRIAGREVVRGDILLIVEGDRVPADAVVRQAINLSVDESLLTGEAVPVRKTATREAVSGLRPGGEDLPMVYSGTLVTGGEGIAQALATGSATELGKIGQSLQGVKIEATPLQKETGRLVRTMATVGLLLCAVVILVYGLSRGNTMVQWEEGFLAGIAMAMAILPEEFPVILTIFLALGAWRISRSRVLTRRMPAIETLGAATVLCVDKTGTLTQNCMSVHHLWTWNGRASWEATAADGQPLPELFHELVEYGILAGKRDPFDPMEKAFQVLGNGLLAGTDHLHPTWHFVREYPLSRHLLAVSHVWERAAGGERIIAAKGAPEAVGDLCHLSPEEREQLTRQTALLAGRGLRVLGVAKAVFPPESALPADQHDHPFTLIGLVGLADPIRPAVPAALTECYAAGIRVIMITGDYPDTARAIARQIGLRHTDEVITGPELAQMEAAELTRRIPSVDIFARVVPEQKLQIVNALKAHGEVVAMTGDGVNDAPALKSAHIGIAMGNRGTDVAREAADLVLLDDDFSSIVRAIRLGRRIYDNIKKAIAYVFAVHMPIVGLSLAPIFWLDLPLLLLPIHIVFLELIIDPSCSIIFEAEPEEPGIMRRPPRSAAEHLFGWRSIGLSLLQGGSVLLMLLAILYFGKVGGYADDALRAGLFAAMVTGNLGLILTNRSWERTIWATMGTPNPFVWWIIGGASVFLGLILVLPTLRLLFHFAPLQPEEAILCLVAGIGGISWFEVLKVWRAGKSG